MSIDLSSYRLGKASLTSKLHRVARAFRGAPEKLQDLAYVVVDIDPDDDLGEALEEIADAAVNEWLRQDVPEGPPPDVYVDILLNIARAGKLVVTDEEIEKIAGEVEMGAREEEEEA